MRIRYEKWTVPEHRSFVCTSREMSCAWIDDHHVCIVPNGRRARYCSAIPHLLESEERGAARSKRHRNHHCPAVDYTRKSIHDDHLGFLYDAVHGDRGRRRAKRRGDEGGVFLHFCSAHSVEQEVARCHRDHYQGRKSGTVYVRMSAPSFARTGFCLGALQTSKRPESAFVFLFHGVLSPRK